MALLAVEGVEDFFAEDDVGVLWIGAGWDAEERDVGLELGEGR